jgi:toxin HigB-1
MRYTLWVIKSWKNKDAKEVFEGRAPRAVPADILKRARRVLAQLNAATVLEDMSVPPGNRLHKVGEAWAVRVNDQYRVTFVWGVEGPEEVWLDDYH